MLHFQSPHLLRAEVLVLPESQGRQGRTQRLGTTWVRTRAEDPETLS